MNTPEGPNHTPEVPVVEFEPDPQLGEEAFHLAEPVLVVWGRVENDEDGAPRLTFGKDLAQDEGVRATLDREDSPAASLDTVFRLRSEDRVWSRKAQKPYNLYYFSRGQGLIKVEGKLLHSLGADERQMHKSQFIHLLRRIAEDNRNETLLRPGDEGYNYGDKEV